MDPLTHAASGAVAMLALPGRPATRWSVPLAALACAFPDIDLAFISTPLQFLFLHRGITHSLAGAPVFGFLLALCCRPLWRRGTPGAWRFRHVWLFCCAMILLHIWLDMVTTYGTMIFLPFSHCRVRLNSVYIIDLLVTVPLFLAIWRGGTGGAIPVLAMAWIFFYPALGIGLNHWHALRCEARFATEGRQVTRLHVLPDAFAPFFWRVIFEEAGPDGLTVRSQGLDALGRPRSPELAFRAAPPKLLAKLQASSLDCDAFFRFTLLPVMAAMRQEDMPSTVKNRASFFMFYDLRFGSAIGFVNRLLAMRPNADLPFLLMLELLPGPAQSGAAPGEGEMEPGRVRLRFSDSGRDSGWHAPAPRREPPFWAWLAGLS